MQVTGTRRWLRLLKLPVEKSWRPWRSATGQVGGYYERYQGLTFVTIRDAGHMVTLLKSSHNPSFLRIARGIAVGSYCERYQGLNFVTIHDAGYMHAQS